MPEHHLRPRRTLQLFRRLPSAAALTALVTVAAVVPGDAGSGASVGSSAPNDFGSVSQEAEPKIKSLHVPAARVAAQGRSLLSTTGPRTVASLAPTATDGYSMLGVTWSPDSAAKDLRVDVRTRHDRGWSEWAELHIDVEHGPAEGEESEARGGTAPLWVGESDGIQVRVLSDDLSGPKDVKVQLIDPGETAAQLMAGTTALTPIPRIITRRQWGANERMSGGCWKPISADTVEAVFVHHTVGSNNYTKAQSESIVRGIYAYHTQSRGWCDVGYNFLVDRYGQIFEGRDGGVRRPVRGAHAGDVNTGSTGISLMGNFETSKPTKAMQDALVRLVAWQLESRYRHPQGTAVLAADRYDVISGHRDAMSTACPGKYVYAWLPELRDRVEDRIRGWRSAIYEKWQQLGGESGWVGSPFEGERWQHGGRNTVFNNATIYWKQGIGAREVHGPILGRYQGLGQGRGRLGFPTTNVRSAGGARNAVRVHFQNGRIYDSDVTGAREIYGPILNRYDHTGGARGRLGLPTTGIRNAGGARNAVRVHFQNGRIYDSDVTRARAIHGPILKRYDNTGGARGRLGLPTTGIFKVTGGLRSNFQHGSIRWDRSSNRTTIQYN